MNFIELKNSSFTLIAATSSWLGSLLANLDLASSLVVIVVSVILTSMLRWLVQSRLNVSSNRKLEQEAYALFLKNTDSLLVMKEEQIRLLSERLDRLQRENDSLRTKIDKSRD